MPANSPFSHRENEFNVHVRALQEKQTQESVLVHTKRNHTDYK